MSKTIKLRDFTDGDSVSIQFYANNRNVSRYLFDSFPYPYTIEDATLWTSVGYKEISGIHKAIDLAGECVGAIGITPGEDEYKYSWEIAYWLGEPKWGKGYGSESLRLMTDYAFKNTEAKRLFALVLAPNLASRKILEKCEYKLEGILRCNVYKQHEGGYLDEYLYARTRS